jgi:hypothetical protein
MGPNFSRPSWLACSTNPKFRTWLSEFEDTTGVHPKRAGEITDQVVSTPILTPDGSSREDELNE